MGTGEVYFSCSSCSSIFSLRDILSSQVVSLSVTSNTSMSLRTVNLSSAAPPIRYISAFGSMRFMAFVAF